MIRPTKLWLALSVTVLLTGINCQPVAAEGISTNYEQDYLETVFNSKDGLEGTAAKCIYSSSDGFLWIGSYTGLYRYDGTEFQRYFIDDGTLLVNDIVQDENGMLWLGTNGNGIYRFDGEDFTKCSGTQLSEGTDIINRLVLDEDGTLFAATKNGLLLLDTEDDNSVVRYEETTANMELRDIGILDGGEMILVDQEGTIFVRDDDGVRTLSYPDMPESCTPRCIGIGQQGTFYVGTNEEAIIKVNVKGEVLRVIDCPGLSTVNAVQKSENGGFWICSDTGIGFLQGNTVRKLQLQINDSVEEMCTDYQGNLWFVSSRQGILQLYENGFSDLGTYWGLNDTVNALLKWGDVIYVGTDSGLNGYRGKEQVSNELTAACEGERIRHLYLDNRQNLWVSTYQNGLKQMQQDGTITIFNKENSGLKTDRIRCVRQQEDGGILIGTEQGLYVLKDNRIRYLTENEILNSKQILDVAEYEGTVYAATDGYGLYEIRDGEVINVWNKQRGMQSNIVMKVVPSAEMQGVWLVTGEDIYLLGTDGSLQRTSNDGIVNARDLLLTGDGYVVVLAGNGIFYLEETELLAGNGLYLHYDRRDGLPVDFTSNACNSIDENMVYMCGTTGVGAMNLYAEQPERGVRLFLNGIIADGEPADSNGETFFLSADTHRINIDVRPVDYAHQNLYFAYQLEGLDEEMTYLMDGETTEVSYTNLPAGDYTYHFYVSEYGSNRCVAELEVPLHKEYRFWEIPQIRGLLIVLILAVWGLMFLLLLAAREKGIQAYYRMQLRRDVDAEIAKTAYMDLATGAYNRNRFEQEKDIINMSEVSAFFSVSVNHADYLKGKYGNFYFEGLLRKAVEIIAACSTEPVELYRVSENVFCFWRKEQVDLERFVADMKEHFAAQSEDGVPLSLSVGAVYNNTVDKEKVTDLFDRCEKMRLLDEKHAEAEFIEGKMKLL